MPSDDLAKQLIKRYEKVEADRGEFEEQWQDVSDQEAGRRDFTVRRQQGERRMTFIYDTTALHRGGLLSAGMHALQSNPSTKWFRLVTMDPRLMDDVDVQFWLEDAEEQLLNVFRSPRRGFNSQMHEVYIDEVWFGNAGFFIDDIPGFGPMFSARPLRELYWLEDEYGRIDTVFRNVKITARNAWKKFGDKAGKKVKQYVDKDELEETVTFLHVMMPTDDPDPRSLLPQRRMKLHSVYIARDDMEVAGEGGYEESPLMTPRWEKCSDETYGRGPGVFALADAMMLNEMSRTVLTAGQKATNPPILLADDNIISNVRVHPNGVMIARADAFMQRRGPIETFPVDARGVGIGHELLRDRQEGVSRHFMPELLSMITNAGKTPMTATQVSELTTTYMNIVSPILGGQQSGLLGPTVARTFAIEKRRGSFLPEPTILKGAPLRVEYQSPAARAQTMTEVNAIRETILDAQQFAQTDPDVLHNLSFDEAIRRLAKFRGVPASVIVAMAQVLERREAEAKLAQERDQMEQMMALAAAAKDGAGAAQAALPAEAAA
jgi:hypothetical protein